MVPPDLDVLVVGAGLSGVCAAVLLKERCPDRSFSVVEARDAIGGTWDLFRYPGIRSDSDMYTLGYSFRPWTSPNAIADGPSILAYVRETAAAYGVDEKIRFGKRVQRASWSSAEALWTVEIEDVATGRTERLTCRFLFMCTGYYRYDHGYTPELPGRERFGGAIVHPQHWPEDLDVRGKRVVVIGSGATAMTLVPALASQGAHVTMLQRSPTYVISRPTVDPIASFFREHLPEKAAYAATRWKNVALGSAFYAWCRRFPAHAKRTLVREVGRLARGHVDVERHFTPTYGPWDQRVCLVPDRDLFAAIDEGKAEVVTDHVETFTETGIRLRSGAELRADVVVTATGLELLFLGGATIEVDGEVVEPPKRLVYKGLMLSDVPNLAMAVGYTNASWTLKCELSAEYVCRLLQHMQDRGLRSCVARREPGVGEEPIIDFSSGYVRRAMDRLPRQGTRAPWKLYQSYALDRLAFRHSKLEDGVLTFSS